MSVLPYDRIINDRFANMAPAQISVQLDAQFEKGKTQTTLFLERINRVKQLVSDDYMRYQYEGAKSPANETLTHTQDAFYLVYGRLQRIFKSLSDLSVRQKEAIAWLHKAPLHDKPIHAVQRKTDKSSKHLKAEKTVRQEEIRMLHKQHRSVISVCAEMRFELRILEYKLKFYSALVRKLLTNQRALSIGQLKAAHIASFSNRAVEVAGKESMLKNLVEKIEAGQPLEKMAIEKFEGGRELKECKIKRVKTSTSLQSLLKPLLRENTSSSLRSSEKTELRTSVSPTSGTSSQNLVINDIQTNLERI